MMDFIDPQLLAFLGVVGSGGVAWGVSRATQGHIHKKADGTQNELNLHVKECIEHRVEVVQRLARIETKIDAIKREVK